MTKRLSRLLKYLGFVLFLILLIELPSYVILRVKDQRLGDSTSRHRYAPFRGHRLNPDYYREFDTEGKRIHSSDGFRRDEPIARKKPPGVYRIFAMGGSALYGVGGGGGFAEHRSLRNDETITFHLERLINAKLAAERAPKRVEVVNTAVTGYAAFQHLLYLNERLWEYQPDMILTLDGQNGFYTFSDNFWADYNYSTVGLVRHLNERDGLFTLYVGLRFLGKYSNFFKLAEKAVELRWTEIVTRLPDPDPRQFLDPESSEFSAEYERAARNSFLRTYHQMVALGDYYGFTFLAFLQPSLLLESETDLGPEDLEVREILRSHYGDPDVAERARRRMRDLLPEFFQRQRIPFYDVATIGSRATIDRQLYLDYCHLTPFGSEVLARKMLPEVYEAVLEDLEQTASAPEVRGASR